MDSLFFFVGKIDRQEVVGMGDERKYVPYHKMGFKLLGDEQINNMFPEWNVLLRKIEAHRRQLKRLDTNLKTVDSQYNLMYDNIFSIFGKRGSGKTSAIFTLKDYLQNKKGDLVLPVIMPEMIPKDCDMIGWILSLFEDKVLELNKKREKQELNNQKFASCLYQPRKTLLREYEEVKELCFSQYYKGEEQDSMSKSVLNYERRTQNSYNFSARLASFWDILVREMKQVENMEAGAEPLIYLIFDDVDLVPETVSSLFSTIIKYLSHPNLIVFVTADEELLYDVVENDFNHRLGKNDELSAYGLAKRQVVAFGYADESSVLEEKIAARINQKLKIMEETPRFYCDKILPPASRYYLESFDSCERKSSFLCGIEQPNGDVVYKNIREYIEGVMQSYINSLNIEQTEDFLHCDCNFINAYLMFWGNTARQLANEQLIFEDFIEALKGLGKKYKQKGYDKRQQYFQELYYIIRAFAFNTLNADSSLKLLRSEIQEFVNETIMKYPEEWGIYINYSYIKVAAEQLIISAEKEKIGEVIKQYSVLFVLLFFIENILILEGKSKPDLFERRRAKVHGLGNFLDIMQQITKGNEMLLISENAEDGGLGKFLYTYEKVLEKTGILFEFDVLDIAIVRKFIYTLPVALDLKDVNTVEDVEKLYQANPEWVKTMTVVLFFCNEGIYNIAQKNIPSCRLSNELRLFDEYYMDEVKATKDRFCDVICWDRIKMEENRNRDLKEKIEECVEEDDGGKVSWQKSISIIPSKNLLNIEGVYLEITQSEEQDISLKSYCNILEYIKGSSGSDQFYQRIENATIHCDGTEMRDICSEIINDIKMCFKSFTEYSVKDKKIFNDLMNLTDIRKIKPNENDKIDIFQFDKFMSDLQEEMVKAKFRDYESNEQLKSIYQNLSDSVEIFVQDQDQRKEAVKIIALYGILDYTERIYLNLQMDRVSKSHEGRIDVARVPYQNFYKILKQKIQNGGDYLSDVLRRHLREYVDRYYSYVIER